MSNISLCQELVKKRTTDILEVCGKKKAKGFEYCSIHKNKIDKKKTKLENNKLYDVKEENEINIDKKVYKNEDILNEINENNILEVLDREFSNYVFNYDTDLDYIISNIISLRYETKNENLKMANKINNFLIENINEIKKLNVDIICKSPYFEEQIEEEKRKNEETDEIVEEGIETCYKCNSKRIRVMYKQVRSSDEGETGFFECSECGNKWTK